MKSLILLAVTAVSLLIGCASTPTWVTVHDKEVKISWHKNQVHAPVMVGDVCNVFSQDTNEGLLVLGEQVTSCFDGLVPSAPAGTLEINAARVIPIVWHRVEQSSVPGMYAEMYGMPSRPDWAGRYSPYDKRGFYFYQGEVCHFVAPDSPQFLYTRGHETKHCFSGLFHDGAGNWIHN